MKNPIRGVSALLILSLLTGCMNVPQPADTTAATGDPPTGQTQGDDPSDQQNFTEPQAGSSQTETSEPMSTKRNPYEKDIRQPSAWTKQLNQEGYNLKGIEQVRMIGLITGDGSPNKTRERFQVGGTDLGIPVLHKDKLYLFFGDTMTGTDDGKPMEGGWRSNVLAYSTDRDFSDGLDIDGMITSPRVRDPYAKELIESKKKPGVEHTVIPTGGISRNGALYSYFMSIKEWGEAGRWTINYGGLAKSVDDGQNFDKIDQIRLDPDRFGQAAPILIKDMIYLIGIGGGRMGPAYLMRVPADDLEQLEAYEYYTGLNEGNPVFSSDPSLSAPIVEEPVGEPSIMFNEYLGEYVLTYLDEHLHSIVMRVAKDPWGPWSDALEMVNISDYPGLYGGFVHEAMTVNGGETFYFVMSMWDPIYNSLLVEVKLKR